MILTSRGRIIKNPVLVLVLVLALTGSEDMLAHTVEKKGVTYARQYIPSDEIDYLATRSVDQEMQERLDVLLSDPIVQTAFKDFRKDKRARSRLQNKGFDFFVASRLGPRRNIFKHAQFPGLVFKLARGEGKEGLRRLVGRVWYADLVALIRKSYGFKLLTVTPKLMYFAFTLGSCNLLNCIVVEHAIDYVSGDEQYEQERAALFEQELAVFRSVCGESALSDVWYGSINTVGGVIIDTEPHHVTFDLFKQYRKLLEKES